MRDNIPNGVSTSIGLDVSFPTAALMPPEWYSRFDLHLLGDSLGLGVLGGNVVFS